MPTELSPYFLGLIAIEFVFLVLRLIEVLGTRRMVSRLPPNTSGGTPDLPTERERLLIVLFCCFVATVIAWLLVA